VAVTDGADVHVRFGALEFLLGHGRVSLLVLFSLMLCVLKRLPDYMELGTGFEPATSSLPRTCSTTELPQRFRVRAPIDDDTTTIVPTLFAVDGQKRWGKIRSLN